MKSIYYQFVNFIQQMHGGVFACIWFLTFALIFGLIIRFFKIYNGTQKKFEKLSLLVLAIILSVVLAYLTYLRK